MQFCPRTLRAIMDHWLGMTPDPVPEGTAIYVSPNFKTKKAIKEALAAGKTVEVFSPGPFPAPRDGHVTLEGPHYPEPHRWYAQGVVADGKLVSIK